MKVPPRAPERMRTGIGRSTVGHVCWWPLLRSAAVLLRVSSATGWTRQNGNQYRSLWERCKQSGSRIAREGDG
jgi:hypothetical protein